MPRARAVSAMHLHSLTLDDILITQELSHRPSRPPNWQAEAQAMQPLAQQMVQATDSLVQTLADTALALCQAGTTGVSLLETTTGGEEVFRWSALAGTLSQYVGTLTPRGFCPSGVCLEQGGPVLFSHPERYFTCFRAVKTPIVEGLVLPLTADGQTLGTIWLLLHDQQRRFDLEDVRLMTSLANFAAAALVLKQRQTGDLLAASAALETAVVGHRQTEEQLGEAQRRLELSLNGADLGIWTYSVGTDEFWADERANRLHGHAPHEVHTLA
ncbi:MAG TPA: GAF domain-containing protein, partial [Trichocoleus sp.]